MRLRKDFFLLCLIILIIAMSCSSPTRETKERNRQKSCKEIVQEFYAWYVPKALKENEVPPSDIAIKQKSGLFSTELLEALREDSEERSKAIGEIVGLDFDPFLNTQDPSESYIVGNVTQKDDRCWTEIFRVTSDKKSAKPDVVPELIFKNNKWQFINFHYGKSKRSDDENLVNILENFRETQRPQKDNKTKG